MVSDHLPDSLNSELTSNNRAFLGQCPIAALSIILVLWRLPEAVHPAREPVEGDKTANLRAQLARIDIFGALLLPSMLVSFFVALDFIGKSYSWFYTAPLGVLTLLLAILFVWVEKCYAKEPILPIELVTRRDVLTANAIVALQLGAQFIVSGT